MSIISFIVFSYIILSRAFWNRVPARALARGVLVPLIHDAERMLSRATYLDERTELDEDVRILLQAAMAEVESALEFAAFTLDRIMSKKRLAPDASSEPLAPTRQYRSTLTRL